MTLIDKMFRIRMIEHEISVRYFEKKMRTPVHLSIGQEAAAVGVAAALDKNDQAVSTHRAHAHYLAMGGSVDKLIAELYGKATGCSGGHGGSMHLIDRSVGFMGSTSIVGGTIPIGVGLAWAKRLKSEPGIVVVFHGDASVEEGVWHESVNFAVLHKLPVLFVCENNRYSCFTPITDRQPKREISTLAKAHGLKTAKTNSRKPHEIAKIAKGFKTSVEVEGPAFFEIMTDRYLEHCGPANDDHLKYRDTERIERIKAEDPLNDMKPDLNLVNEITKAFRSAENAPGALEMGLYANQDNH